jgi:hypothetical protein
VARALDAPEAGTNAIAASAPRAPICKSQGRRTSVAIVYFAPAMQLPRRSAIPSPIYVDGGMTLYPGFETGG